MPRLPSWMDGRIKMKKRRRKTYRVEILSGNINYYLEQLKAWGVDGSLYEVSGNVVTTRNANVVDVATESFFAAQLNIQEKMI